MPALTVANVPPEFLSRLSIAYEPVWAIGNALHHETDGVLIGGAGLKADKFLAIVHAAMAEILAEMLPV